MTRCRGLEGFEWENRCRGPEMLPLAGGVFNGIVCRSAIAKMKVYGGSLQRRNCRQLHFHPITTPAHNSPTQLPARNLVHYWPPTMRYCATSMLHGFLLRPELPSLIVLTQLPLILECAFFPSPLPCFAVPPTDGQARRGEDFRLNQRGAPYDSARVDSFSRYASGC